MGLSRHSRGLPLFMLLALPLILVCVSGVAGVVPVGVLRASPRLAGEPFRLSLRGGGAGTSMPKYPSNKALHQEEVRTVLPPMCPALSVPSLHPHRHPWNSVSRAYSRSALGCGVSSDCHFLCSTPRRLGP
eukprot:1065982-Rhodomonas_salina.5